VDASERFFHRDKMVVPNILSLPRLQSLASWRVTTIFRPLAAIKHPNNYYLAYMSELRKANSDNAFFVTITVVGWIDVFIRADYCDEIIRNLAKKQRLKDSRLLHHEQSHSHDCFS
jgi:hypothetical protein